MRLNSIDADKTVEVLPSAASHALVLRGDDGGRPFLIGDLSDMFVMSTGRPWRWELPGLTGSRCRREDDQLCISGFVGALRVTVLLRFVAGLLQLDVRWKNRTAEPVSELAVGLAFRLPEATEKRVTIPQVLYNNNPSADPGRIVPKLGRGADGALVVEEHRLPIPAVNAEWRTADGPRYFTLFSLPSYAEDAAGRVAYGSLGARHADQLSIVAMSGVLNFNGAADVRYVHKGVTEEHPGGYITVEPGAELHRRYVLDWGGLDREGHGFRQVVGRARQLFAEDGARPLSLADIIHYKSNALDDRWRDTDGVAGYVKFNDSNPFGTADKKPLGFLYGWTGQCLRLGWCDATLGVERHAPARIERCRRAVDFYLDGSATSVAGLRTNLYGLADRQWSAFEIGGVDVVSSRAHGETMCELADIISLFTEHSLEMPDRWVDELTSAADFFCSDALLATAILPLGWRMDGSAAADVICAAGLPAVLALIKTHRITGDASYRRSAVELLQRYHELHAETFERPFARATLDAACEDKESGIYYFLCAYELYRLTGAEQYAEWARVGADWLLTFVYQWNPVFDRDSPLRRRGFNCAGWPGVSVQNHHLDVFFPIFEVWDFGRLVDDANYVEVAERMIHAMGQGISTEHDDWGFVVPGEQAEGFFQTDWQHRGTSNRWNPSWVIAQVLMHALRMRAAGLGST